MTNFEYYKNELLKLAKSNRQFGFDGKKIMFCYDADCNLCKFNGKECRNNFIKWLYEEHREPIKLTAIEHLILQKALARGYKYIARDKPDALFVYDNPPIKKHRESVWSFDASRLVPLRVSEILEKDIFQFVKREDEEPYDIEKLLKENK